MSDESRRLTAAVQARLWELGLSLMAWKRASGVNDVTLRQIRDGTRERWTARVERSAERGLGWAPLAFDLIRAGQEDEPNATAVVGGFHPRRLHTAAFDAFLELKGLTVPDAAKALYVSRGYISDMRAGRLLVNTHVAICLASLLGLRSPDAFLWPDSADAFLWPDEAGSGAVGVDA